MAPVVVRLMVKYGEKEEGLKVLRAALNKWPDDARIAPQAALILVEAGKTEEGLKLAQKVVAGRGPGAAYMTPMMVELMMKAGKVDEGIKALEGMRATTMAARGLLHRAMELCFKYERPEAVKTVARNLANDARTDRDRVEICASASSVAARHKAWDTAIWLAEQIL